MGIASLMIIRKSGALNFVVSCKLHYARCMIDEKQMFNPDTRTHNMFKFIFSFFSKKNPCVCTIWFELLTSRRSENQLPGRRRYLSKKK